VLFSCRHYRLVHNRLVMIMHLESSDQNVQVLNINFLKTHGICFVDLNVME